METQFRRTGLDNQMWLDMQIFVIILSCNLKLCRNTRSRTHWTAAHYDAMPPQLRHIQTQKIYHTSLVPLTTFYLTQGTGHHRRPFLFPFLFFLSSSSWFWYLKLLGFCFCFCVFLFFEFLDLCFLSFYLSCFIVFYFLYLCIYPVFVFVTLSRCDILS